LALFGGIDQAGENSEARISNIRENAYELIQERPALQEYVKPVSPRAALIRTLYTRN